MTALRFDPTWQPERCEHHLVACRRCGTAQPGLNRHWPQGPTPPRSTTERPQFRAVANRADRRAAGKGQQSWARKLDARSVGLRPGARPS